MKKILYGFLGLGLVIFGVNTLVAQAEGKKSPPIINANSWNGENILIGPDKAEDAPDYIRENLLPSLTNMVLIFILSLSVGAIIIAGIIYIASSGNSEMTKKAKDIIFWTIVSVFITALSYSIVSLIVNTEFI